MRHHAPSAAPATLNAHRVLRWIFIGRLTVASAIFAAAVTRWESASASDTLIAALSMLAAIAFTVASAWYAWYGAGAEGASLPESSAPASSFLTGQPLFDLALVTAVVHLTGGAASQFAALYILVMAAASLLLPVSGGLLIAALGCTLYAADAFVGHGALPTFQVGLQLLVFVIVALSTAYLGARLREAGRGREELEAQLVLARLQADDILKNIRSGIVTVDAQGRVLYMNPAAAHLLGAEQEQAIGQPMDRVITPVAPKLAAALGRAVRDRVRVIRGEALLNHGGKTVSIGLTTTTIDAGADPMGVSATAIFQDISESKRLEGLRVRAERLEGIAELSASLAHEIKNPLASIRSAVEQLARSVRADEDERVLGALIVRESDRLARLLTEFIDFARVRVHRSEPVDIASIARTAARLAATHPDRQAEVRVECALPDAPVMVEGDEDLLHRALFNLALNAVQAAPEGGRVGIELSLIGTDDVPPGVAFERGAVSLRITDDGAGIPADVRERVFDPFFTTKAGGTGLGLPIVHRAIDAHRGLVLLKSSDAGTQFTILLPYDPAAQHATPRHVAAVAA